ELKGSRVGGLFIQASKEPRSVIGIVLFLRYREEPSVRPYFLISIDLNPVYAEGAGTHLCTGRASTTARLESCRASCCTACRLALPAYRRMTSGAHPRT